jgi:prevent-host-death family protein
MIRHPREAVVQINAARVYNSGMDVAVTELRAHLSEWVERARGGDEIVITDRGVPVARLLGLSAAGTLQRLAAEGVIGRAATAQRPTAAGRARPRPRRPVADIVGEQRR